MSESILGRDVTVIGAGPAGLTAAYELSKSGKTVAVLESDPARVGGISRTVEHEGNLFDIGGHRFFSKSEEINHLWREILPEGFIERPRLSRIFYKGKFYGYPLDAFEALRNLGPTESARCVLSFLTAKAAPIRPALTFEDWVSNAFGARLFSIFFKTYSEKVWGMPCSEISADWAAQRIKGLDLGSAMVAALRKAVGMASLGGPKTLIGSFQYPRRGPGMMWAEAARKIDAMQGEPAVRLGHTVVGAAWDGEHWTVETRLADGSPGSDFVSAHLVCTAPLAQTAEFLLDDAESMVARKSLRYRDYVLAALVLDRANLFPDQWIYVHDPDVGTGRIQNFGAWSPEMLADPSTSCLGFEYFCNEGDLVWRSSDSEVVAMARQDLGKLGFLKGENVLSSAVVRQPKAYPVYDSSYRGAVETIRRNLERRYPTLHLAGRNGMHRYNNQDHAMMSGVFAARNIAAGGRKLDPWRINDDAEYVEQGEVPSTFAPPESVAVD